jgi:hypothetical protein
MVGMPAIELANIPVTDMPGCSDELEQDCVGWADGGGSRGARCGAWIGFSLRWMSAGGPNAGRRENSGEVPIVALPKGGYRQRTGQNVVDSDATAIIYYETLKGGTGLARNLCALEKKPYVLVDARKMMVAEAVQTVVQFVQENGIRTLNVAGPRASGWAEGIRSRSGCGRGIGIL